MLIFILLLMWYAAAISAMSNLTPYVFELPFWHRVAVYIIVLVGSPFMLVVQALEILLEHFLPGGWQDDD